jgi:hypothetical protein
MTGPSPTIIARRARGAMLVACLAVLAGCPTRTNPDVAGLHLNCDEATHICAGTLAITSPGAVAYTNAKIAIQVTAMPANNPPAEVQIRKNGATLVTVPPPFSYSWDTSVEAEGSYQIDAVADVGGQTITSAPVTIWVDRTPPAIDSRTPAQNATNVALSDPIQVVFKEALDPSSVSPAAISLASGGVTLSTTASLESDGKTIDVSLGDHSTLSFPATITATVSPSVKDLAGNVAGAIPSWSWSAPLWVKLPSLTGRIAYLALDSTGRATVAYLTDTASSTTLNTAQYAAGATWNLGLGSPSTASVNSVSIAIGKADAPVIAWTESNQVLAASWNGTGWGAFGGDATTGLPTATAVQIASVVVDASGAPTVGWTASQGTSNPGYVARWGDPGWSTLPSGVSAGPGGPILRLDSAGDPVGYFPGSIGSPHTVESYVNGAWVSLDADNALLNSIAVDSQNRPVELKHDVESNLEVIHVRVHDASGWSDLTPSLPTGASGTVGAGYLALGSSGKAVVAWIQVDATGKDRVHVARFNGTNWDTTYGVLSGVAGSGGSAFSADLGVDPLAAPTVAWSEQDTATGSTAVYVWKSNY